MVIGLVPRLQRVIAASNIPVPVKSLLNHPAGPLTIHFYAGLAKWALFIANVNDFKKPIEMISSKQQLAMGISGFLWFKWCFAVTPMNYPLAICNLAVGFGGWYQLSRKWKAGHSLLD